MNDSVQENSEVEFHPLADILPLMQGEEYEQLKADIKANGLLEPIYLFDNKIIDGRNRYRACKDVGVKPKFRVCESADLVSFIISENLNRRHLNESQRAVAALKLSNIKLGDNQYTRGSARHADPVVEPEKISQSEAAKKFHISDRIVRNVKIVEQKAPELIPKIKNGDMTAYEALKEIKKTERKEYINEQVKQIKENNYKPPAGLYDVIVVDPPWPYQSDYDPEFWRGTCPYPTMSLKQIKAIKLPTSENCVLWLWTTHKFMRHSFNVLDAWGFNDVSIITWVKDRMGLGVWLRSQSEYCIMAIKGKPKINLTNQTTVIHAKMREHSRKPDEFYEMVDNLCIGYKLDYFSREKRDGWESFGNETEKFNSFANES